MKLINGAVGTLALLPSSFVLSADSTDDTDSVSPSSVGSNLAQEQAQAQYPVAEPVPRQLLVYSPGTVPALVMVPALLCVAASVLYLACIVDKTGRALEKAGTTLAKTGEELVKLSKELGE